MRHFFFVGNLQFWEKFAVRGNGFSIIFAKIGHLQKNEEKRGTEVNLLSSRENGVPAAKLSLQFGMITFLQLLKT